MKRENCGLVADPDSPEEVAAAIQQLKADPAKLNAMGQRARKASEKFMRQNELEKFGAVLEEAAQSHRGQGRS